MTCLRPSQEGQAIRERKIAVLIKNVTVEELEIMMQSLNEYRERKKQ